MFGRTSRGNRRGAGPARSSEALRLTEVRKVYGSASAGNAVTALDDVSLSLAAGSFTAVMGPSGSGKSTLLQCAAGLDRPDSGLVLVDGAELTGGSEAELTRFRRRRIGFVFQQYNLLPTLTVAQNATLPLKLAGRLAAPTADAVAERLAHLGDGAGSGAGSAAGSGAGSAAGSGVGHGAGNGARAGV
jgi:putative ABC transport system ATP-binding protein